MLFSLVESTALLINGQIKYVTQKNNSTDNKMLQKFYNHHFTCTAMPDEYGTLSK